MFNEFGVDPVKFALQCLIGVVPAILATIQILRYRSGLVGALWLFLVWTTPLVGAILALVLVRRPVFSRPGLSR